MARGQPTRNKSKIPVISRNVGKTTGQNMGTKTPETRNNSIDQWPIMSKEALPTTLNPLVNHTTASKREHNNGGNSSRISPRVNEI